MTRYTAIARLNFPVPKEWFVSSYLTDPLHLDNVLFQVRVSKDKFIYVVHEGNRMNILSEKGLELVQEKYVESKL